MITRKMTPFFHLLFEVYSLVYFIFVFQDLQIQFHGVTLCIMFWSVKYTFDDDHDKLFLWYGRPTKGVWAYFQREPLSEILTVANLRHAASRISTCAEPEFRICSMKLNSSDHHTTTLRRHLKDSTFKCVDMDILFLYKIC